MYFIKLIWIIFSYQIYFCQCPKQDNSPSIGIRNKNPDSVLIEQSINRNNDFRQSFPVNIEEKLDDQINKKYSTFYAYQIMSGYFNHPNVGFCGFSKFFMKLSNEKLNHARQLTHYLNKRGGKFNSKFIIPEFIGQENKIDFQTVWPVGPLSALQDALNMERIINERFLDLNKNARIFKDPLTVKTSKVYMKEEMDAMVTLRSMIARLGNDTNVELLNFLMDQELLSM